MPSGRPTSYSRDYDEQARQLALLGVTDKIIAEFFEVDEATIHRWKKKYKSFCDSIRAGKLIADGQVAGALYKKAMGFIEDVEEPFFLKGETVIKKYKKFFPPETQAIRLWLLNRQKALWRDRHSFEFENMSDEQLSEMITKMIKQNEQQRKGV